jgi:hypothetical protein
LSPLATLLPQARGRGQHWAASDDAVEALWLARKHDGRQVVGTVDAAVGAHISAHVLAVILSGLGCLVGFLQSPPPLPSIA